MKTDKNITSNLEAEQKDCCDDDEDDKESVLWENWNPMKELYENKTFNSYHQHKDHDRYRDFTEKHAAICG